LRADRDAGVTSLELVCETCGSRVVDPPTTPNDRPVLVCCKASWRKRKPVAPLRRFANGFAVEHAAEAVPGKAAAQTPLDRSPPQEPRASVCDQLCGRFLPTGSGNHRGVSAVAIIIVGTIALAIVSPPSR